MELRRIKFPDILAGSGILANFGNGYWYTRFEEKIGILNKNGLGFVSKTATLKARAGNTPFIYDENTFPPAELKPKSIIINPLTKKVINAVGLGNPGLEALLKTGNFQNTTTPFFISIMCIGATKKERLDEMEEMIKLLLAYKSLFKTAFGLQINVSCPNAEHDTSSFFNEIADLLDIANMLGVPIMVKFSIATANSTTPIKLFMELNDNPKLDAICLSNTIPYYWEPDPIFFGRDLAAKWKKPFGEKSPLHKITNDFSPQGGGGISSDQIRPYVLTYIKKLRDAGFSKHINGGGGIMHKDHINLYHEAGVDSAFICSVVMVRPLRVKGIISRAKDVFSF